jgi:DNA polymerase-1
MGKNDALNYPIQGSAFHCLLLSMIYMNRYLRKNKMRTKIIGQIYDSIVFDMCPDEKEILKPVIRYVMTKKIKKKFDWIIVPLDIEIEVSEINGNWNKMQGEEI